MPISVPISSSKDTLWSSQRFLSLLKTMQKGSLTSKWTAWMGAASIADQVHGENIMLKYVHANIWKIGRGGLRNATSQEAAGSLDQRNGAPARSPCEGGIAKKSQVVFLYTYSELVLGVLSLTTSRPSTGRKRLNGMINLGCTKRPCSKR